MSEAFQRWQDSRELLEPLFDETVRRFTLPNGLTVVHKEDQAAKLVSIQAWVKTGSIHENRRLGSGVSHYLEHLLFKGTERRTAGTISRQVQEAGGNVNAYTSFDRTVYYLDLPSEKAGFGLDLLWDMTQHATLAAGDVTRERDVILREIDMGLDDPDRQVSRALFGSAFRQHPYRHPVIGHRDIFERLTRDDLAEVYHGRYAPNNCALVVVGAITGEELEELLNDTFAKATQRTVDPVYIQDEPEQLSMREERLRGDVQICRGAIAYKIPGLAHADAPALDVLATVLGGGNSSILSQRLRDKKRLVHHIDAWSWNPGPTGLLGISFLCDNARQAEVEAAIAEELTRIAGEGITDEHVGKALQQALVSEINSRKTVGGQASRLGLAEVIVGDLGYPRYYFEQLGKVQASEMTSLIDRYLTPGRRTTVSLTNREAPAIARSKAPAAKALPDFELITLSNGARVAFQVDKRLPKIHLRYAGLGGPLYDSARQRGITGVMATLLTKDTRFRAAADVEERIESVGGVFREFVGNNTFGVSMEVLPRDFERGFQLVEEGLLYPGFKPSTFELERDAQIAQLQEDADEIAEAGKKALRQRFFGSHPLAIDPYGRVEDLQQLTPDNLRAQYGRLVTAPNAVLSLCGDFDPDRVIPLLELFLNELPSYSFEEEKPAFKAPGAPGDHREIMQRNQAVVFEGYPAPGLRSDDYLVSEMADEILSDMSGGLFQRVREEKGLAYFVSAARVVGLDTSLFYLFGGTAPGTVDSVQAEFASEIERMREGGVTEDELKRAKTRLKSHKRMSMQTPGARAMEAALNLLYEKPLNHWRAYDERLNAIGLGDIQAFAARYFLPPHRVGLVIGPDQQNG